ncbi:MAG: AMP-binding protein, partial [Acidimicrobiales bacterium]
RVHPSPYRPARNDLAISLEAVGDRVYCEIEYRTALFEQDRIERLAEHYRTVLAAIVDDPDQRLSTLDIVTGVERRQVLFDWNDTARDFPRELPVTALFAEHVAHRPDAVAVYSPEGNLTYRRLDEATTALALRLRALGVGPEDVVGVCVPRSAPMVVALLGVLKAGGAYLALDSCQPTERIAVIVGDSGASVLVTCQDFSDLAVRTKTTPVFLDAPEPAPGSGAELPAVDARNLAYVLYTSGSTGRPNGVAVSHRALARLVKNPDYCELGPDEVHLQLSPISFDASLIEVWGPLLNGGAIAIPRSDCSFLEQFREGLASYPVTTVLLISPQLPLVLEDTELLGRLQQLLIGGDVLSPRHAKEAVRRYPNLRFIHVYGPTEVTLF